MVEASAKPCRASTAPGGSETWLTAHDGTKLQVRQATSDADTAHVVWLHGLSEHLGRFAHVELELRRRGFGSTMFDLRGHGRSGGARGHVARFEDYLDDLELVFSKLPSGASKVFLVGHSLGGLIAARYVQTRRPALRGVVLASPVLRLPMRVPSLVRSGVRHLGRLGPGVRVPAFVDVRHISRSTEVVQQYRDDPLVLRSISVALAGQILEAIDRAQSEAAQLETPMLLLHGTSDQLVDCRGTEELYGSLRISDRKLVLFSGLFHELHNEPERDEVFGVLGRWLSDRA
jgi:lysophospholipase